MDEDVTAKAGEVVISRQLLEQGRATADAYDKVMYFALDPANHQYFEEQRRKREAEWDAKTAQGLVGLADYSDYECDPDWRLAQRGRQEKWTTAQAWAAYEAAVKALKEAEEAL